MENQKLYSVEVIFKKPTKLPYDNDIQEEIMYVNVVDWEIVTYGIVNYLELRFIGGSEIVLREDNISAFQVDDYDPEEFEDKKDKVIEDIKTN